MNPQANQPTVIYRANARVAHPYAQDIECSGQTPGGQSTGSVALHAYNLSSDRRFTKKMPKLPAWMPDFKAFVNGYEDASAEDLIALSPVSIHGDHRDAFSLINELYAPDEYIFIGERWHTTVRTAAEWHSHLHIAGPGLPWFPLIAPNPVSGQLGMTKTGRDSYRCADTVADYRFAVAESDCRPLDHQVAFWAAAINRGLPVAAVVFSGGKSLHGWLSVNCVNADDWERSVKERLFPDILVPMGFDPNGSTASSMSRLPGHFRLDKQRPQCLLYLNPEVVK